MPPPENSDVLIFYVNGKKVIERSADPETTLLTYLRDTLRLTGSKLGCGEGGCGACTVMISKWDKDIENPSHFAVNACLAPLVSVHECAVTTVEGIGSTKTKLHQIQERLAKFHGSQCGFCTPGIVMSMYALLRNKQIPTSRDIETCLQGNLCRCTGYRPIIEAFETFTCPKGKNCCKFSENGIVEDEKKQENNIDKWETYDNSQEPIFPPELTISSKNSNSNKSLTFIGEDVTWHQPSSLQEMLSLKSRYPDAKIVVGNTEVGIEMNIKRNRYVTIICPINVKELNSMKKNDDGVSIGAACSLNDVEDFLKTISSTKIKKEVQVISSILEMLELFAGVQIRNVACLGGNIMTASPISDLNPIFLAVGAKLTFASANSGLREVMMDETFFTGYRRTKIANDEILVSIKIPFFCENDVMKAYKQSRRKEDDIAIVNAGMHVNFKPGTNVVEKLSIAYGGMAPVTKMPIETMRKVAGRIWDASLLEEVCCYLNEEMKLALDAPGGMIQYRRTLVTSFFFKFYHHVLHELCERGFAQNQLTPSQDILSNMSTEEEPFTATQTYQEVPPGQPSYDTIGRSHIHLSGLKHVTGEAVYIDDIPPYNGELHMVLVCSTRTHAKIVNVDTSAALKSIGVVDYVDRRDVVGENVMHELGEVFADGKVTCIGHVIGAIVADTQAHAWKASQLVKITYEDIQPKIITIEDALKHNSFYESSTRLKKGDVEEGFKLSDQIIEEEIRVGGQEHFYLETQACIAIPKNEDGEMEIISSCQDMNELQKMAAMCLGVDRNKVTVRTKRLGGGFGGKQSRFMLISNPTATAARKLGKPVRCILTRQEDMQITGGRHPYLGKYKVGFTNEGRIMAIRVELYSNGGNTADLSFEVMLRSTTHADNCYNAPHMEVIGRICKTNIASNTAFRGFGAPQCMIVVEDWITRIADTLNVTSEKIRELNMYKNGDTILHGNVLKNFQARRCWDECLERSGFNEARKSIEEFNKNNRWKKRGIACIPSKYSVGYGVTFLEQAGALVLIYADGGVLLSHGGVEMGQGLHTKMIQVASRVLGIPMSLIHISESSTASVPNSSPSAASMSSDLNGMAVKEACEKLVKRLEPLRKLNPDLDWRSLCNKAYMERISLAATGFYMSPGIDVEWNQKTGVLTGNMFNYLAYGAAVSQVEIDVLTGHHVVLRTDIVIDVGNSLNPAIDIGQIEGAFAQGYGLMTLEEKLHSSAGQLWNSGPGSYKIPGFSDIPKKFNVHFLRSCPNEKAIYCSKAVGEPPLFLAASVLFGIKDAIKSARLDAGITGPFRLDSPATAERIRIACEDEFTHKVKPDGDLEEECTPWALRT